MSETPSAVDGLEARTLGGFVLRQMVGAGGFGDVYLAEQVGLKREAVVKVLRSADTTPESIQRFLREAQLASRLDHPYAAHIYAFGAETDGVLWIAMELVRGSSLRAILEAQGPMSIDRFVPFFERICEVVHTAHDGGIIHRDLKPDNIMVISRAGRLLPKLLDFGIARAADDLTLPAILATPDAMDRPAAVTTQRGSVVGSPSYMAPELWLDAHAAVAASDQYALGALAHEMLTGKIAFGGKTMFDVARAHARGKRAPLGDGFPPELEKAIKRSLARAPGARFGNVLEFGQALRDASGIGTSAIEIPQIDEELRARFLAGAPQPIADAVAAYDVARNPHQAREALRSLVRVSAWYLGILALASRTRVGSGGSSDSEHTQTLLRDLRRNGLTPIGWVALARQLTQPFAAFPDTHPVPELVLVLHPTSSLDHVAVVLEGTLSESLPDSSDDAAIQSIARELPAATAMLRAIEFVLQYQLIVPRGPHGESWMGTRTGPKRPVALGRTLAPDRLVIVDDHGSPLLAVWPLMQLHVPLPGQTEQLFMLTGPGRQGARLAASPHNFEHRDDTLWDWFRDHLFDHEDPGGQATVNETPYRGLSAYSNSDAHLFFGRERETEAMVNRLKLEPFVAVVGPSGVGKSSFVHAGLVPALTGWRVVTARPGRKPLTQLAGQLAQAGLELGSLGDLAAEDIAARIKRWAGAAGLLVVIDQFEELITLGCTLEEQLKFVRLLLSLASTPDDPVRVVITLRDDFLIRIDQIPGLDDTLARGLQLLAPLGAAALERIIVEPARRAGYEFEDAALPARMVQEILGAPAAVALLSFTASRLWELRDRHFRQLPRKAYDALGGVGGALARHADAMVDALAPGERALARTAFRHLVTFEGTRAVLGRDELTQLLGSGGDAERLLERLVSARLVSSAENDRGEIVIEIVHEALLGAWPRLVEWRREDVEGSRFHEQLRAAAKQWADRNRPRGLLWRGDALAEHELWRRRHRADLTPLEAEFGAASARDAARGRRIRRVLILTAASIVAIFVLFLWRANAAQQRLRQAAEDMLRDATFEQGRLMMLDGDPLGALPKLRSAYQMGETRSPIRLMLEQIARDVRAWRHTLVGHTASIQDATVTDDGRTIATTSVDGTLRIWDAATGTQTAVLPHAGGGSLLVAASLHLVAAGGRDGKVQLWDVDGRRELASLDHGSAISSVMFSPDGTRLVVASITGVVKVWNPITGELVRELLGHHAPTYGGYCADQTCFGTWDFGGTVIVWDAQSLAPRTRYERSAVADGLSGAIDRTGSIVAIGTDAGELDLLRDGQTIRNKSAHEKAIYDVAISPDGATVATASVDGTARLWDAHTGALRVVLAGHRAAVMQARFSPDGALLATVSCDKTARLWNATTGQAVGEMIGHANCVSTEAFSRDGTRLITGSWDNRTMIWDVAAARQVAPIEPARLDPVERSATVVIRSDSARIAMIAVDGSLAVVDSTSGVVTCRAAVAKPITKIAWSLDGNSIATVSATDDVGRVWSSTCVPLHTLAHPRITTIAFGSAGRLVTGGGDRVTRVWNGDGTLAQTLAEFPGQVSNVWWPEGRQIYVSTRDKFALFIEDLDSGRRQTFPIPRSVKGLEVDGPRHRVYVSAYDHNIWVIDPHAGTVLAKLEGGGPMYAAQLSPDGKRIVGIGGLTPTVWDADTWERVGTLEGHREAVGSGQFIDDQLFLTADDEGRALLWDLQKREQLAAYQASEVVVSPDRRFVVLVERGGTALWRPGAPVPDLGVEASR